MTQDELVDAVDGRQLVLHFDVRNTLLVADSVSNVDVAECLNSYLTSVAWGIVGSDGIWRCIDNSGRITSPQHNGYSRNIFPQYILCYSDLLLQVRREQIAAQQLQSLSLP